MIGWQWHQLDHTQIICTSLQTDNHATTHQWSGLILFFTHNWTPSRKQHFLPLHRLLDAHTQPFYGPLSGTTRVSWRQKRTSGLNGAREDQQRQTHRPSGWAPLHPHQSVLTSTILPIFFTGRMPFLPPNQQHQSTEGN